MAFVDETIDVLADVRVVYSLWVAYEGYPNFMSAVERVSFVGHDRLHWVADVAGAVDEWDARLCAHVEGTLIKWEALDGRETGEVTLGKVDAGTTRVHYQLQFDPDRWGADPAAVCELMDVRVRDDLRAFKEIAEALT